MVLWRLQKAPGGSLLPPPTNHILLLPSAAVNNVVHCAVVMNVECVIVCNKEV
jgi:hypothetical protein